MSLIEKLGYEQIVALSMMLAIPDMEGSEICKAVDCSFEELYSLANAGLIDIGSERLKQFAVHPIITDTGKKALDEAKEAGIIDA